MPTIHIQNIDHVFEGESGEITALKGINLEVQAGEFICLLGPSGCGKSTLLNIIAGFIKASAGKVLMGDQVVTGPGPDRGMVFQEYALFPWLTVSQNIEFGLELQKMNVTERKQRVQDLLKKFSLTEFAERFPRDLSGGMKQRVAIARLLALDSPVLLMDEPFGALDALTRRSLQDELLKIWLESKKTVIFVTHSIEEAIFLADRIIVMTYRPGMIKKDLNVNLPRSRDPISPEFNAIKRELTELVMTEQRRHESAERKLPAVD